MHSHVLRSVETSDTANKKPIVSGACIAVFSPCANKGGGRDGSQQCFQPAPMIRAINVRVPMVRHRAHRQRANRAAVVAIQRCSSGLSAHFLGLGVKFCDDFNGASHTLLRQCCPSHRIIGACNIAETTRWISFISTFGRFGATTGCSGRGHMALQSCRLNIIPTNHGLSPSTPPAPRFRDARVTCSRHWKPPPPVLSLAALPDRL
jgi:hypothetical protein